MRTESDGVGSNVLKVGDLVVSKCDVCVAFDKAPHLLAAGTSLASAFNGKVQVDLPFLGNLITLRAMDLCSRFSMLVTASPRN